MKRAAANATLAASASAESPVAPHRYTNTSQLLRDGPVVAGSSRLRLWARSHIHQLAGSATNSKVMSTSFSASIMPATAGGSNPKSVI